MSGIGDMIRGAIGEMQGRVTTRRQGNTAQGGVTAMPTVADFNRYRQQAVGAPVTGTPAQHPQSGQMYAGGTPGFDMRGGGAGPKPGGVMFHPAMMNQLMQSMAPMQPPPRINAQGLFTQLMASMQRRG